MSRKWNPRISTRCGTSSRAIVPWIKTDRGSERGLSVLQRHTLTSRLTHEEMLRLETEEKRLHRALSKREVEELFEDKTGPSSALWR
jgi:hypothetical protein